MIGKPSQLFRTPFWTPQETSTRKWGKNKERESGHARENAHPKSQKNGLKKGKKEVACVIMGVKNGTRTSENRQTFIVFVEKSKCGKWEGKWKKRRIKQIFVQSGKTKRDTEKGKRINADKGGGVSKVCTWSRGKREQTLKKKHHNRFEKIGQRESLRN